ncbi:MAG: class I SAM-dependent methyltransferase [Planctomycetota bacterium]|jgi:cyclopropane fatty-acyl-phospholipid synthase-like methyltransferase
MENEKQKRMDDVYKNMSLDDIPWNNESPPELLVNVIETAVIEPCRAIDLGCGAGNYAIYLASKGFEVTGIDFSPTAIKIAKENAKNKGVKCNLIVSDVIKDLCELHERFDFAYDWGLLHHILPENRGQYVENVSRLLTLNGKYLSLCFSEKDKGFEGEGKYRKTFIGSTLYFSSEEELRKLFSPYFEIMELRTIEIDGKLETHTFNYVFMKKK